MNMKIMTKYSKAIRLLLGAVCLSSMLGVGSGVAMAAQSDGMGDQAVNTKDQPRIKFTASPNANAQSISSCKPGDTIYLIVSGGDYYDNRIIISKILQMGDEIQVKSLAYDYRQSPRIIPITINAANNLANAVGLKGVLWHNYGKNYAYARVTTPYLPITGRRSATMNINPVTSSVEMFNYMVNMDVNIAAHWLNLNQDNQQRDQMIHALCDYLIDFNGKDGTEAAKDWATEIKDSNIRNQVLQQIK